MNLRAAARESRLHCVLQAKDIAWLRRNAKAFHLQANHIAVCGFSAGGHLAASLCNLYSLPLLCEQLPIAEDENCPDAALLCYPVISSGEFAHVGSFENLCGDVVDAKTRALLSLETSVHANCLPCFLWHTADDNAVPSENTLLYAMALRCYHIPLEMHVFFARPTWVEFGRLHHNQFGRKQIAGCGKVV